MMVNCILPVGDLRMLPHSQSPARLAFGPFEVNVAAGELLKSGVRIRLSSQPFKILLILLAHPADVVSSEQLREEIWADGTFVDFEHGLHAAVNKLRRALGDSAEKPRYIETVPGRGYRFVGAVEHRLIAPIPSTAGAVPTLVPSPRLRQDTGELRTAAHFKPSRRWWTAAAVTVVLGALGVFWAARFLQQPASDERVFILQINPPEDAKFAFGANNVGISLSPDGKIAAYVATHKGKTALWVRPLDSTTARPLAGTEDAGLPFWSPDSKSIAFFAEGKLQRVELAGGAPQTICEMGLAPGGSWGRNGQILFAAWGSGLYQVAASGGQPSPLTTPDASRGEVFHYWPQILPGGRFLYFARSHKRENTGVYAASLAKPREPVQLLATDTNALYAPAVGGARKGYLLWLRGGNLVAQDFDVDNLKLSGVPHPIADPVARMSVHGQMLVSVSATGALLYSASAPLRQFTWVDRLGKQQDPLGEPALSAHFRLSPDGRRVVVTRINTGGTDLWMLDVGRAVWSRFTSRPGINIYPVWSPDDRTIVFASDAPFNLFRKDASGANSEQRLTHSPNPQFPMDWSRDGRFILYEEDNASGKRRSLWILPAAAGEGKPRPYLQTPFNEYMGRFSPDSRRVAFQSNESGRYEVYVDTFPEPSGKMRISTAGGIVPQWSANGRELFYISPDFKLMSVGLKVGASSVEPSVPHALFPLPVFDAELSPYEVATDGERFLVLKPPEAAAPLTVIVNWPALLNKTANAQ
jgi:Tol biopolymer transport system component/DNA-binding winged helix-turn-helix (wHTH) protein